MVCPFCQLEETSVVDSRKNSEGTSIRRRRNCVRCNLCFAIHDKTSTAITVKKRTGNREEFNLEKLHMGVHNAFAVHELSDKTSKTLVEAINNVINDH